MAVDIFWLGHAAFRIRSGSAALIMDPFSEDIGLRIPAQHLQANVVTTSGQEPEHAAVDVVQNEKPPVVLTGPGEYEASGLHVKGVRCHRVGTEEGAPVWNTMFVVEAEGVSVCHLGNPARLLTNRETEELGSPHVLLLPVGSKAGLTPADAVEVVNLISPKVIVPMLYAHEGNRSDLRDLGPFLQELGVKSPEAQARLTVSRSSLPEETQVVVLQPVAVPI